MLRDGEAGGQLCRAGVHGKRPARTESCGRVYQVMGWGTALQVQAAKHAQAMEAGNGTGSCRLYWGPSLGTCGRNWNSMCLISRSVDSVLQRVDDRLGQGAGLGGRICMTARLRKMTV